MPQPLQVASPDKALKELPPVPNQSTGRAAATPEGAPAAAPGRPLIEVEPVSFIAPQIGFNNRSVEVHLSPLSLIVGFFLGWIVSAVLRRA